MLFRSLFTHPRGEKRPAESRQRWRSVGLRLEEFEPRLTPAGGFTITPMFDPSITGAANAAAIENTINAAITYFQSTLSNPINVSILFQADPTIGGGSSQTSIMTVPYAQFRAALASETQTADTMTALANLPTQANNPVNNAPSLALSSANVRALGIQALYTVTFSAAATMQFSFSGATSTPFTYTPGTTAAQDLQTNLQTIAALDAADGRGNDMITVTGVSTGSFLVEIDAQNGNVGGTLSASDASVQVQVAAPASVDSTITLNPTYDPATNFGIVEHEMDEALGFSSALPNGGGALPNTPNPIDLYRYTAGPNGARIWSTTDTADNAYFSLDGNTDFVQFNESNINGNGGDYSDFWSNNGGSNSTQFTVTFAQATTVQFSFGGTMAATPFTYSTTSMAQDLQNNLQTIPALAGKNVVVAVTGNAGGPFMVQITDQNGGAVPGNLYAVGPNVQVTVPTPAPRVQDASGNGSPTMLTDAGQVEIRALNVIGYTLVKTLASPAITSPNTAMFTAGQVNTFQVTTTGFPTPSITVAALPAGLPAGLTFVDNQNATSTLTIGNNVAPGTYSLILTAQNPFGTNITPSNPYGTPATQTFTLTINQPTAPPPGAVGGPRKSPGAEVELAHTTSTLQPLSFPMASATLNSADDRVHPLQPNRVSAVFTADMDGSVGIAAVRSQTPVDSFGNDPWESWFSIRTEVC
ncbi:MAG TPA: hypothetical protein VKU02_23205 [Gemmataceae bacterium]|nr:hypothetical protein [Gemmataceae bacterium]